jgi:two-component system, NarL family, sensor kinase
MKCTNLVHLLLLLYLVFVLHGKTTFGNEQQADSLRAATADSLYNQVLTYRSQADLTNANLTVEKFIEYNLDGHDSARLIKGYYQNAFILKDMSLNELSIKSCKNLLALAMPLKDTHAIIVAYNLMGNIFKDQAVYDSAALYFQEALKFSESKRDDKKTAIILNNLGDVSLESKYYSSARTYYKKSLEISGDLPNSVSTKALPILNLGRLASMEQKYEEAIGYYNEALALYNQLNDSSGILNVYNNYGDVFFKQEKYKMAKTYFEKALKGYQSARNQKGIVIALGNLAAVELNLGNYQKAVELHDSCLLLTYRIGNMDLRMDAYWNFSETFFETGNYKKSHEYLLNFLAIKDSVYDLKKSQFIYDLTLKYEKEKDQARILTLEKENLKKTIQRNSVLYGGLGIILLAIFIILFFRQRAVKDKIIAHQKIRQLEEEKKLMVAKMMIEGQEEERKRIARELHDGLGVLLSATKMQFTAIKDVSPENRPMVDKAIQLLEQASGDVRKISHNMMPGLLTKLGFFEAVEDLFDNLNDTGNLKAILKINGSQERLPENREIMLYRIVQEMINNTLKYAEAKKIKLIINVMTDHLTMVFADDGVGFDVEKVMNSDSESLGLKSIQSRVNFLNGEVTLESRPGEGVKYSFRVPLT